MCHSIAMHAPHERRRGRAIAKRVQPRFMTQAVSSQWFSCLCAILFVCVSGGCVLTETRLSDPEAATVDENLLGDWVSADDTQKHLRITTTDIGHLPKGFMRCEQKTKAEEPLVAYMWKTQVGKRTFASIPMVIKDGLRPVDCAKEKDYREWRDDPHAKSLLLIIAATNEQLAMHEGESVRLLGTRDAILEKLERDPTDLFSKAPSLFRRLPNPSPTAGPPPHQVPSRGDRKPLTVVDGQRGGPTTASEPARGADLGPALPTFSDEEWQDMLAELRRQGKLKDADEWLPALRLAKKVFVDEKIPKPSPRMICKLMNEFALFNSPPNEAAKKLRELFLAAEGAGVRMATREQLLALEDGHVALPLPRDEQRPMQKHGLMGVFPALGQIPFGISERELRQICPVELKKCECDERLVGEPFRNWEFPGDGVTAVYSDGYPVSDKKTPVQFIFRDDVLVGIGVHCGEADLDGVVSVSKVLEKVYGDKRLMGSRAKMEKVLNAIETKEFVGTARMCFGGGKAILQLEAFERPAAHVIFSNEDQSKWPEEAKTRRALQLDGMDM